MKRFAVNKGHSAKQFRDNTRTTHGLNLRAAPMRGGWRL